MKRIIISILTCLVCCSMYAQTKYAEYPVFKHSDLIDQQTIPQDTALRKGVLDNGLTYYVYSSKNVANRAFFQLLVKAGSAVEKDNERGIAHFTEHMMFKGTKHFPGEEVIGFMQRNGIPFGHDSNAFTGFNTVRYLLNSIPTNNEQLIDSCLLLLRDWAADATIDKKDVKSEHNVIVEEWRSGQSISFAEQMLNDILANSDYSQRYPIGDMKIVENCSAKLVKNFYKRWYQPQNQAIAVVGDFDADEMVEKVRNMFGDMKRGGNISPAQPVLPDFSTPKIAFYQDKQMPYVLNGIIIRTNAPEADINTMGGQRTIAYRNKIENILNRKLEAIKAKHKDMYDASIEYTDIADIANTKSFLFGFGSDPANSKKAYELLAKQLEFLRRNGFKDEDWKKEYIYNGAATYNEDSTLINFTDTCYKAENDYYRATDLLNSFATNFFAGNPIMSRVVYNVIDNHIENSTTKELLDKEFRDIFSGKNTIISYISPEGADMPSEEDLSAIFDRVRSMTDEELADIDVTKAKKFEILHVDSLDITTIQGMLKNTVVLNDSISEAYLSNGVKVVFWNKKTDNDNLNFLFRRPSGFSVLKDNEIHYNGILSSCVRHYEFYNGSAIVNVKPFEDALDHCIRDREQLESLMKFFYAALTSTEVDSVAFEEEMQKLQASAVSASNPMMQSVYKISYLPSVSTDRLTPPTMEELTNYNLEGFRRLVKEYYSNYNGSTLIVQGECNKDSIMPLILKYIGALPSKAAPVKRMTWSADHYKSANSTLIEKIANATPICSTNIYYTWEKGYKYTQESHAHNEVLGSVLGNLLLNTLRIQHSDVYTPRCGINDDLLPINRMKLTISYTCNPTQRERIAKDVQQLLHDMADGNLITQSLIDSYIKEREKGAEHYKSNEYSLRRDYLVLEQDGIVIDFADVSHIKKVTPASLKAHLKQLLQKGNIHIGYLTTE